MALHEEAPPVGGKYDAVDGGDITQTQKQRTSLPSFIVFPFPVHVAPPPLPLLLGTAKHRAYSILTALARGLCSERFLISAPSRADGKRQTRWRPTLATAQRTHATTPVQTSRRGVGISSQAQSSCPTQRRAASRHPRGLYLE